MPVDKDPDIWALIFEQTPQALRWVLGVASLGVFTLLSVLYRMNQKNMDRVEGRISRLEERMDRNMQEQNRLLTQIASNTGHHE